MHGRTLLFLGACLFAENTLAFMQGPLSFFPTQHRARRVGYRSTPRLQTALFCSAADPVETVRACALSKSVDGTEVVNALEALEAKGTQIGNIPTNLVAGDFDLVFSSTLAKVPLINGYMPTKEVITWDIQNGKMTLDIATLPFLPKVLVEGTNLTWEEGSSKIAYTIKNKEDKPPSEGTFFFADDDVLAGRSSVTGLNVLRRV